MWALVYKEFVQIRNYLLQVSAAIIVAVLLFGNSLEGFIQSYLGILPLIMAMTFPQFLFGMEDKGSTLVFLRSLPVRPRQIVAAKYVVSAVIVGALMLFALGYSAYAGRLVGALAGIGPNLLIAAILLGLSLYLHFRLGSNSAKIALLISLTLSAMLGMAIMQNRQLWANITSSPAVSWVLSLFTEGQGAILSMALAALILWLSFIMSARVFTRQDVSRIP